MFTGDTKISLVDGTEVPIKDLVGRDPFWVYSYDHKTQRIVPGKATAFKTRENAELVEVELDNGEHVRCTPDHQFMLRDGSYREAKDLTSGTSLMPLYREIRKDSHRWVRSLRSGGWFPFYSVTAGPKPNHLKGIRAVRHHKDFNPLNDSSENLEWMTLEEHVQLHHTPGRREETSLRMTEYWSDPIHREEATRRGIEYYENHPEEREEMVRIVKARFDSPGYHKKIVSGVRRHFELHPEVGKEISERNDVLFDDPAFREKQTQRAKEYHKNHPVEWEIIMQKARVGQQDPAHRERQAQKTLAQYHDGKRYPVCCLVCRREFGDVCGFIHHQRTKHLRINHKVVTALTLNVREDIFRLEIPNFTLSVGVFCKGVVDD